MFALALWDERRRRLLLARDHVGVKPLYWWSDGRRIAAASEIGALLELGVVDAALDPVALDHYLAWRFVPAPRTLFAGVSKLPPASLLLLDDGRITISSYREPPGSPLHESADELAVELRERLVDAVQRQTMSDVGYGAFLSGGLDSAAVAAAIALGGDGPPSTFTIGFPGHGDVLDERAAARRTAELLGAVHRDTAMVEADFPAELSRAVRRLEEPCGVPSAVALLELSRFARRHVKVVLAGQGADEPLGGYPRHRAAAALVAAQRVPRPVASLAAAAIERLPRNERAKRATRLLGAEPGEGLMRAFEITDPSLRTTLQRTAVAEAELERRGLVDGVLADVPEANGLERALYLDTHLFLPDGLLIYGDKMTMAYGLEQRVPFLDVELMRFVQRIPATLRVRRLSSKWLYRRALRGLLPDEVLARPKHPFATPYDDWLRSSLGLVVESRYGAGSALTDAIAPEVVARLVTEHRSGRHDHKRILYCLLELAAWHECFVENGAAGVSDDLRPAAGLV
jgi:asparagine synthase (glutamine-hydrolysing)